MDKQEHPRAPEVAKKIGEQRRRLEEELERINDRSRARLSQAEPLERRPAVRQPAVTPYSAQPNSGA